MARNSVLRLRPVASAACANVSVMVRHPSSWCVSDVALLHQLERRYTARLGRLRTPCRQPKTGLAEGSDARPPPVSVIQQFRIEGFLDGLFFCPRRWDSLIARVGH